MTFKDQLATDLETVFFNADEFAISANYNGTDILAIEADSFLTSTGIPGVTQPIRSIMVRQADVATVKVGDKVVIDGQTWHVGPGPALDGGVWTVTLNAQRLSVGV